MSTPIVADGHKKCPRCKEIKAFNEFSKCVTWKMELDTYCKLCKKAINREYRKKAKTNPEWLAHDRERRKATGPAYAAANREKMRMWQKEWRERNREKEAERKRVYSQNNHEKEKKRHQQYRLENPDKRREQNHRYRARKAKVKRIELPNTEKILWDIQSGKCLYCNRALDKGNMHTDHILPLSMSEVLQDHPGHTPENLALTCVHCNESKGTALLEDWLAWKYPDQMDEILYRVEAHMLMMKTIESALLK